jgi:hypothetical protein
MAPSAGMGDPAIPSVTPRCAQMRCRTREVMRSDDHQRATTRVSPTMAGYGATAADSSIQNRSAARTATRGGKSKWSMHDVVAEPGQAAGRAHRLPTCRPTRASPRSTSAITRAVRTASTTNPTALHSGMDVRWTIPPPVAPDLPVSPGVTARVLGGTTYGARKSRPLPGVGRVADRHPG